MATFCKPQNFASILLVLFIFTTLSSLSSARLLNGFLSHDPPVAATATASDLALADLEEQKTGVVFDKLEQDPKPQALPCDHMVPMKRTHVGILRSPTQRLAGKYGPMILSRLPKGAPLPPSAPSKGTNNIKN